MADASQSFLGVDKSYSHRRWLARDCDERLVTTLVQRHGLPDVMARIMVARGIGLDMSTDFLDPTLRSMLPDPSLLKDMDRAATRMVSAIKAGERIAIYGDYDVDGATSSALMLRFLRAQGIAGRLYVPDRRNEGYGPNPTAMQKLADEGVTLTVCVDCGTMAYDALARAKSAGMDVIVLDHHTAEAELPIATAIVNPNRLDEDGKYGYLAAVGVTYLFVVAVNRALRVAGWYGDGRAEPDLRLWLDLVALGTICDVVRLQDLNRAFVVQGLKVMNGRRNIGIQKLCEVAGFKDMIESDTAGYILGPRVNAGGRIGESNLGAQLLSSDDAAGAGEIALHLHELNQERRDIEAKILADVDAMCDLGASSIVFVASDKWHPGVIGIVAARLKDKFHHPAFVVGLEGDIGKGSARSVTGIDIGTAVIAAKQAGLLIAGGGHKMAAGFTVARDKIKELEVFLAERIEKQMGAEPLVPSLSIDGLMTAGAATPDFIRQINRLAPFGSGNPEPRFALADCKIVHVAVVGEKHVSVVIMQGGTRIKGIAFRAMDNALGEKLLTQSSKPCHIAGHLRLNIWQDTETVQVFIDDVAGGNQA